jgi:hypothetical protein
LYKQQQQQQAKTCSSARLGVRDAVTTSHSLQHASAISACRSCLALRATLLQTRHYAACINMHSDACLLSAFCAVLL